jgi:hypothetical protein
MQFKQDELDEGEGLGNRGQRLLCQRASRIEVCRIPSSATRANRGRNTYNLLLDYEHLRPQSQQLVQGVGIELKKVTRLIVPFHG